MVTGHNDAARPAARRCPIASAIVQVSVGFACAAIGLLIELGLDQVIGDAPWLIVTFVFGALAAVLGGIPGAAVAVVIGFPVQVLLMPSWSGGQASDTVSAAVDLVTGLLAVAVGLWIRSLLLRPVGGRGPAPGAPRRADAVSPGAVGTRPGPIQVAASGAPPASGGGRFGRGLTSGPSEQRADRDAPGGRPSEPGDPPGSGSVSSGSAGDPVTAVRDIGSARTAVQVADALARHAIALADADGAVVYVRQSAGDPLVARGRAGTPDAAAPERVAGMGNGATAGRPGRSTESEPPPLETAPDVIQVPFGRDGSVGVIRFAWREPGEPSDRAAGVASNPWIELLGLVAADAIERAELLASRRSADVRATAAGGTVTTLAGLAAELVRARTVEQVARTLVDLAVDDFAAGFAVVHVAEPEAGGFGLVGARGYPAGLLAAERRVSGDASNPVTRVARDRAFVEITGEDGWRSAFPAASNVPSITGVRAITAMPLQTAGVLHGVLTVGWRTPADRQAAPNELLAAAADQGAQALERAILHAQDEDARRLQEAFIAVVSHELRTPITTILAGSRLLRRGLDPDSRAADLSEDIEAEADRLARIVDDLLVLSRLERRHLALGDEPVHLDHLLGRVVRSEAARWPAHAIAVPPSGSHVVRGDETYIEQILRNLISNAAKYSPDGSPVEVIVDDPSDDEVRIRVLDRGAGVAPSEVDELFSLFYRSPSTAASAAGAGIGLFVSRRLVAEMGGRMWAEPRPDGGSEFGFSLRPYPIDEADLDVVAE